jgi:hypothetical protein
MDEQGPPPRASELATGFRMNKLSNLAIQRTGVAGR